MSRSGTSRARAALLVFALVACRSHGSSPASGASASAAVPPKPLDPEAEAAFLGKKLEEMPLALGPLPASALAEEREQRVKELLTGQTPAERLPELSTDINATYDYDLFDNLTTEPSAPSKLVGLGQLYEAGAAEALAKRERGPIAIVTVGQAQLLSGDLELAAVNRLTQSMRAGLRACYQRSVELEGNDARQKTALNLLLEIAPSGDVRTATLDGELAPPLGPFADCAKNRALRATFEPGKGVSKVRVVLTLSITER